MWVMNDQSTSEFRVYHSIASFIEFHHNPMSFRKRKKNLTVLASLLGSLCNDDDDSSENVAKKMNLCPFNSHRVYLDPLKLSNVCDFSQFWILMGLYPVKKKGKFVVVYSRPP